MKYRTLTALGVGTSANTAGATSYAPLGCHVFSFSNTTPARTLACAKFRIVALHFTVWQNNVLASSSIKNVKNGVYGNFSVSIPASTTGKFSFTGTEVYEKEDTGYYEIIAGAGGTSVMLDNISTVKLYETLAEAATTLINGVWTLSANNSTLYDLANLGGYSSSGSSSFLAESKMPIAGVLRNIRLVITFNDLDGITVFNTIRNGSNGSIKILIPANTTGVFTNLNDTQTISAADTIGFAMYPTGRDGEELEVTFMSDYIPSDGRFFMHAGPDAPINFGTNTYFSPANGGGSTNESVNSYYYGESMTVALTQCVISPNSVNGTSTLVGRVNGATGSISVSIPASTTGWFQDAVNTQVVNADQRFNYLLTTGGSSGSMTIERANSVATLRDMDVPKDDDIIWGPKIIG